MAKKKPKPKKRRRPIPEEASYTCDSCGEEIVIPIDISQGRRQSYVEDCPVCCHASVIHLEIDRRGLVRTWSEAE